MLKKEVKRDLRREWKIIILLTAILLAFVLLYSLYTFLDQADAWLYFCEKEACYWAPGDIHATVVIKICGKEIPLPRNVGSNQEVHTHLEKNLLHFEGKLPVDMKSKALLDDTPLQLDTFFRTVNITFNENCILQACNGMFCGGKKAELYMLVNGKESSKFEKYAWSDQDYIEINFEAIEGEY